jgi:putative multiple sugar transport system permease protein
MSSIIASGRDALSGVRQRLAGVNLRQNGIFLALIGLVIFFAITTPDAVSLAPGNFSNLVVQNGYILVLAIGMVMVIIAGHIDLSVGSIAAFIGGVAGILVVRPLGKAFGLHMLEFQRSL